MRYFNKLVVYRYNNSIIILSYIHTYAHSGRHDNIIKSCSAGFRSDYHCITCTRYLYYFIRHVEHFNPPCIILLLRLSLIGARCIIYHEHRILYTHCVHNRIYLDGSNGVAGSITESRDYNILVRYYYMSVHCTHKL